MRQTKKLIMLLLSIFFFTATALHAEENANPAKKNELETVAQRLIRDGFAKTIIAPLFENPGVMFTTKGVNILFSHFEFATSYHQFLEIESIEKAVLFASKNAPVLERAEKTYGVDKTVIVAILLLETHLGANPGNFSTVSMLSTVSSLDDEQLRTRIWEAIPRKTKPTNKVFLANVKTSTDAAYNELKALLQYTRKEGIAPETIHGSYSGTFGICQFKPSDALAFARDGNSDGRIDLFNSEDAIFSVANYLKQHGWKPGLSRQQQFDVIYTYNDNNYYVDTVQKVSDKLKEK